MKDHLAPIARCHLLQLLSLASLASAGGQAAAPAAQTSPELQQKFQDLMHRTREDTSTPLVQGNGPGDNAVSRILQTQQNEFTQMHDAMLDYVERAPTMSQMENLSASVVMMQKATNLHVKTSMATGMTKSANKSLDSLLKNQ